MYFITYELYETESEKKINSGILITPNLNEETIFNEMDKKVKLELDVTYSVVFNFVDLKKSESGSGLFTFMKSKVTPTFAEFLAN